MATLYKIRRPSDGKFFSGSGYKKRTWTSNGRAYTTLPMARSALRGAPRHKLGWDDPVDDNDIEIVEYDVREVRTHAGD